MSGTGINGAGKTRHEAFDNLSDMVLPTLIIAILTDNIDQLLLAFGFKKPIFQSATST